MSKRYKQFIGSPVRVGVYIHLDMITVVKTEFVSNKFQVLDWVSKPFNSLLCNDPKIFSIKLKEVLTQVLKPNEKFQLWTSFPGNDFSIRHLHMPIVSKSKAPMSALWHYQKHLRSDLSLYTFDCYFHEELKAEEGMHQVFTAFSVPNSKLAATEDIYNRSGFELTGVTSLYLCWSRLFELRKEKKEVEGFLYIGSENSILRVFKNGKEILSRLLLFGRTHVLDIMKKQNPDLNERQLHIFVNEVFSEQRYDPSSEVCIELGVILTNFWTRLEQTLRLLERQYHVKIQRLHHCGQITCFTVLKDFAHLNHFLTNVEIVHFEITDCVPSFKHTKNELLINALVLSTSDNSDGINLHFPAIEKEKCLVFKKKQFLIFLINIILITNSMFFFINGKDTALKYANQLNELDQKVDRLKEKNPIGEKEVSSMLSQIKMKINKIKIIEILDSIMKRADHYQLLTKKITVDKNKNNIVKVVFTGYMVGGGKDSEIAIGELIGDLTRSEKLEINPDFVMTTIKSDSEIFTEFTLEIESEEDIQLTKILKQQ